MRQVWILNHYAQVPGGAGGTRHFALARHLQAHGWNASIIAASTDYQTGQQRLTDAEPSRLERIDGVTFLWVRCPNYRGNGPGRMRNMLAYSYRVLKPHLTRDLPEPDVIIGSSVHPFAAVSGAILARRHKVPFLFEVRDLWPQALIDMGRLKSHGVVAFAMRRLEKWLFQRAARIIVLLPRAGDYIVPLGISTRKIVWIPNGVDLTTFPRPLAPAAEGEFTLMYFGAHGQANGLDNVLHAMDELRPRATPLPVRLRLIGDGPLKPGLVDLARKIGLQNVSFEDPVPRRLIPALAAEADAFVFNLIDAPVFKYGISSNKLFDFMAGARPIIFCCNSSNNPVAEAGAGITAPPGAPALLADAIVALLEASPPQRRSMGEAGRAYVETHHGFDRLASRLAVILDNVVAEASGD